MGIDLTIRNVGTGRTFDVSSGIAGAMLDAVMARRDPRWRRIGTPVVEERLDADDIRLIHGVIDGFSPDWPPEDINDFREEMNTWLDSVVGDPGTGELVLESY